MVLVLVAVAGKRDLSASVTPCSSTTTSTSTRTILLLRSLPERFPRNSPQVLMILQNGILCQNAAEMSERIDE